MLLNTNIYMINNNNNNNNNNMEDTVVIPRKEYEKLKMQANIDVDLLKQFMTSFKDIKEGRVRRVK